MFWFFGHEACGILAPRPGIEPAPPALEGEVLTTGPAGKSLHGHSYCSLGQQSLSLPRHAFQGPGHGASLRRTGQSRGRPGAQVPPPLAGSPRAPVQSWTMRLATPNICSDGASGTHQDTRSQVTNDEIQLANQHKNVQPQQELKKCKFKRKALSPIHVAKSARNSSHPAVLTGLAASLPALPCPPSARQPGDPARTPPHITCLLKAPPWFPPSIWPSPRSVPRPCSLPPPPPHPLPSHLLWPQLSQVHTH